MSPSPAELLAELGGVCRRAALLQVVDRRTLEAAVDSGVVVHADRGLYRLPEVEQDEVVAARIDGTLALTSAALRHGWAVKTIPDKPYLVVSRGKALGKRARLAHVRRAEPGPRDVVDGVTVEEVTLRDCLRHLPFDEVLCVADSALRESGCHQLLQRVADTARGPGSVRMRRIAALASGEAANPFESTLRALCLDVPGLSVRPQVEIRDGDVHARVDLADERLRIVVEAGSFEWHGNREALARDCRRYDHLVVAGWLTLRFSYEDVMGDPDAVRSLLARAVALAEAMKYGPLGPRSAA